MTPQPMGRAPRPGCLNNPLEGRFGGVQGPGGAHNHAGAANKPALWAWYVRTPAPPPGALQRFATVEMEPGAFPGADLDVDTRASPPAAGEVELPRGGAASCLREGRG